ncbi:MAG: AMP-binding protein [Limimaricola sp.]|uniref:class I adenylate-forming enzyme family protein n=1 Tax=Limimaricola sp. TaxID=2211665 RepID=UPI001D94487E|nr:class I adenylate-forming enzyme family protein [Limimaricola sp.]MBI1416608.1 AMP-binding protein [Limimaricola sp.]
MTEQAGPTTIAEGFRAVVEAQPDAPAVIAADITLSNLKLWQLSCSFAFRMHKEDIGPGTTVALHTTDLIASLATMLASAMLGARFETLEDVLWEVPSVRPSHVLRTPEAPPLSGISSIEIDATWSPRFAPPEAVTFAPPSPPDPDAPWWIIHTSGTTGRPKFMQLGQRAIVARSYAVRNDFVPGRTVLCSLFVCTARPFFVRATAALLNGCPIVDTVDPAFMRAHGVTLVCGAPLQTLAWLDGRVLAPKLPRLQVSGTRLSDAQAEALLQSFDVVEDVYGASETNKSFVNLKSLEDGRVVSTGKPCDSEVQIIGPSFEPCAPGEIGTVRVRNGYMAPGYIDAPEATARAFQDGWFLPGDYASWGPRGDLRIEGRVDEVINLGGQKLHPSIVDAALAEAAGVTEAVCFRDPDPATAPGLAAFLVVAPGVDPDRAAQEAHDACTARLGPLFTPARIYVVQAIPKTFDGIPRRSECQRLALDIARQVPINLSPQPR